MKKFIQNGCYNSISCGKHWHRLQKSSVAKSLEVLWVAVVARTIGILEGKSKIPRNPWRWTYINGSMIIHNQMWASLLGVLFEEFHVVCSDSIMVLYSCHVSWFLKRIYQLPLNCFPFIIFTVFESTLKLELPHILFQLKWVPSGRALEFPVLMNFLPSVFENHWATLFLISKWEYGLFSFLL